MTYLHIARRGLGLDSFISIPVRGGGTTHTELRLTAHQKLVTTSDKPLQSPEQIRASLLGRASQTGKQTKRPRLTAPGPLVVLFVIALGGPLRRERGAAHSLAETRSYQTTPHRVPSSASLCDQTDLLP